MTKTGREDPIAVRTRFGSGIDGHRGIGLERGEVRACDLREGRVLMGTDIVEQSWRQIAEDRAAEVATWRKAYAQQYDRAQRAGFELGVGRRRNQVREDRLRHWSLFWFLSAMALAAVVIAQAVQG